MLPNIKVQTRKPTPTNSQERNGSLYSRGLHVKEPVLSNAVVNYQRPYSVESTQRNRGCELCVSGITRVETFPRLPVLLSLNLSATAVTDNDLKGLTASRTLLRIFLDDCKFLTSVSALSSIPTLEEVHLRGCLGITSVGDLSTLPRLRILDVSKTSVTNNGLEDLSANSTLVRIFLEDCRNLTSVGFLKAIASLEEIHLRGSYQVKNIGSLGLLAELRTLDASKTSVAYTDLMGLGASHNLEKVLLEECRILADINTLTFIQALKGVFLSGCIRLTNVGGFGSIPVLHSLDVSGTSVTSDGLHGLAESRSLVYISLANCVCLTSVYELSCIPSLEEIQLGGSVTLTSVGSLGSLPGLRLLNVSKTSLRDDGLQGLCRSPSLVKIILEDCVCLTNVCELSSIPTLEEIQLGGCIRVTDVGDLGLLPVLRSLDVSKTAVTDAGLKGLGETRSLTKLVLEECGNLKSVRTVSTIKTMEEIYLRGCIRITAVGLLGGLPALRLLDVSRTSVTDDGLNGLGVSRSLMYINLEDCKSLTSVASLTSIQTITEMNLCGCTRVTNVLTFPVISNKARSR
ncbi:leucine-rich repeat protein 1 (LRRP1) [Trypanosoma grayi]|uniref:leucine-rich repeat protein 1 (LRRP1) n=1 Tax=Trypanosoma grayi TaxID=71804 RepID=UPI0004F44B7A|nr:leucine-rich repeat protein 1 (LRRP1) [Trypanosoma grayi]KEG14957.1 leucine-rich repeat protein 1 (LRRP1) [Trypanosoma grayi]